MFVTVILLAAGKGKRFGSKVSKPLAAIESKPIIAYSLSVFDNSPQIKEIIVVVNAFNKKKIESLIKKYSLKKVIKIVLGGKERQDSVYKGLKEISPLTDLVVIHDAARPFIGKSQLSKAISEARKTGAAIVGVPVKSTIKSVRVSGEKNIRVDKTMDRRLLWEIQTPQVFCKDLILKAYKKFAKFQVTDDASMVEKMGIKPSLILGRYNNIKITTPEDLVFAEAIAKKWNTEQA